MVGIAARDGMVFQFAEAARECHVIRAGDFLVAQEQHLVREQQGLDLGKQRVVARGIGQSDAADFGADIAGKGLGSHGDAPLQHKDRRPGGLA
ncbi:hypothetical protein D9M72_368690 [compost metagenome]